MGVPSEILFIDKPKGITSFDVVRRLRKKLGMKRMGHAGTLDPFATGLLIVGVDKGTKRLNEYMSLPKTYLMDVLLGKRTETGDPEGTVLEKKEVGEIDESLLEKTLKEMEGELTLPIPKYSAVKHKGIPLYAYARKNIPVEEKLRTTRVFYLKLLDIERQRKNIILQFEMKAEKGTYARAVAEEIGRRLGLPAMLQDLRRTKIGDIDVSQAQKISDQDLGYSQ